MSQLQNQSLAQKQLQKFSPQQIQMLNLLQLTAISMEQRIKDEMEENPALEEGIDEEQEEKDELDNSESEDALDDSMEEEFNFDDYVGDDNLADYKTQSNNTSTDDEFYSAPVLQGSSFQEMLKKQLLDFRLTPRETHIASYLIDSLDDDGYMRIGLAKLTDDFSFAEGIFVDEAEVSRILTVVQQMEPAGVGALSLQQCLLLQLQREPNENINVNTAIQILKHHFHDLSNKNYTKILRDSKLHENQLKEALAIIVSLNPKPVSTTASAETMNNTIIPEFIITNTDGLLDVQLTSQRMPDLRISKKFVEMANHFKGESLIRNKQQERQALSFVKHKINAARWFIDAIHQREQTLLRTMNEIIIMQKEFFLTGDYKKLKPMILNDIAERIKMDISTISRSTSTKYAQTAFGMIHIKDLFTSALITENGEEVSNKEVQKIIEDLLHSENKTNPITDLEIADLLKQKGYPIARRTVAKYRNHMNIPIARMRKVMA